MLKLYRLLAALLLALPAPLAALAQGADSVRQFLDDVFAHVDASQVPAPYLEQAGVPLLPLRPYNEAASFGS